MKIASNRYVLFILLLSLFLINFVVPYLGMVENLTLMSLIMLYGIYMHHQILYSKAFLCMSVFVLIAIIYNLIGKGVNYRLLIFQSFYYFTSIVVCYNLRYLTKGQINFLFYLLTILLMLVSIITYSALLDDNLIIRRNAYNHVDNLAGEVYTMGVYSYGLGESFAIILPAMLCIALTIKNNLLRIVLFILVVFGLATQFMASLFTSAMLSLLFCMLPFLSLVTKRTSNKSIYLVSIIILTIIVPIFMERMNLDDNFELMMKLEDINESYSTGQSTGQVNGRMSLYSQSIKVFAKNPIFGFGETPLDFGIYDDSTVSLHTAFFDYLAYYGMFVLFFVLSWKNTISMYYKLLSKEKKKLYKWSIFSLFSLLLLKGPVTIHINFMVSTVFLSIIFLSDIYINSNVLVNE